MQDIKIDEKTKLFVDRRAESSKKYYYKNKEKVNLQQKVYREKNAIQEKERKAKWYRENKERVALKQKQYMQERGNDLRIQRYKELRSDPEKITAMNQYQSEWRKKLTPERKKEYYSKVLEWRQKNPEKVKQYNDKNNANQKAKRSKNFSEEK